MKASEALALYKPIATPLQCILQRVKVNAPSATGIWVIYEDYGVEYPQGDRLQEELQNLGYKILSVNKYGFWLEWGDV